MIEVPRSRESFRRGTYRVVTTTAGNRHVFLCCPGCGAGGLLEDHEIGDDGTVTPSVVCPSGACDWHQMIRLRDWEPEISQEMKP